MLTAKEAIEEDMNIMNRANKKAKKIMRIDKQYAYTFINDAWKSTHSFKKIDKSEAEREKRQMDDNALYDGPFSNMEEVDDNTLYDEPFSNMEEVDGGKRKTKRSKRSKTRTRTKNSVKK